MRIFDIIITNPIAWLIEVLAGAFSNYVFAIFIFAIITRIVLFPLSLWAQAESIKLANLKPYTDDIRNYGGADWRAIRRQTKALYKREKYNSISTILPLVLQLPIIIAVMRAVGGMSELYALPSDPILPILSALSAFALCYVQNKCNVLAKQMKFFAKWGFAIFLTAFSLYFTIISSEGFGVFWIFGNLAAIGVQLLCNAIYNPKKLVKYEILPLEKFGWALWRRKKAKQRQDVRAFYSAHKELVFYSEKSGFYKYYKHVVENILENSNIHIHYLTSDFDDQVFNIKHKRFHAYYCGPHKLISVFMKLDCKVCVMTLPDFHKYQYKRSLVKDVNYMYIDHGFGSLTMVLKQDPLKFYDTVFCYGPNYNEELRAIEKFYGSKEKELVNIGFPLFEEMRANYTPPAKTEKKSIIIAPSWQKDNIFDFCLDDLMQGLSKTDYDIVLRPHPEYIKRFPLKIKAIKAKYKSKLQLDFQTSILSADILVTDWSTVAYEFSYATNKPSIFINTPMKVLNPNWDKYGMEPIDITLRNKIGIAVDMEDIKDMPKIIAELEKIKNSRQELEKLVYDVTDTPRIAGTYIIRAVRRKK
ncbi:MAG: YidC/Oxa1 family membrane protein insertase [Firmicutes bacterium]|nr:YidC/Oxa1 family membrane protein insertase [Bacillota bacterium]